MKKKHKIDLHTHSIISHDGGIKKKQYIRIINDGILDYVAITDHNETSFARSLQRELGEKIIVGEEIKSKDGEIIGLFLKKTIPPGLSALETVNEIQRQDGLVYIPHPFETVRDGLQKETMDAISREIDIVEVFNARGYLRGKSSKALEFSLENKSAKVASSDAHCLKGIGTAYTEVDEFPTKNSLIKLLNEGVIKKGFAPWYSYFCPRLNKVKNKLVLGI